MLSKAQWVEESKPGTLEDRVRGILEAFGTRQGLGRLQVQACLQDLADRNGIRASHWGPGWVLIEARMPGLAEPALVVGISHEGDRVPDRAGRPLRLILVHVGLPAPLPEERGHLLRLKSVLGEEAFSERLSRAKGRLDGKEILRMIDHEVSLRSSLQGQGAPVVCLAQLLVRIQGEGLGEAGVRSAIVKAGAAVSGIERGMAPNGEREERITFALERGRSLDDIVRAVGTVPGVAVRGITLMGPAPDSRPA